MSTDRVFAIIPARFQSSRFPGKPLVQLLGKEMILWVVENLKKSDELNQIIVATDDDRIASLVKSRGHDVVMTRADHRSGTDRVREVADQLQLRPQDIVVNVQGDEPLVEPDWVRELIRPFAEDHVQMSTLGHPLAPEDVANLNAVKVLVNRQREAIYFSRHPIPFSRVQPQKAPINHSVFKHMGLYAFRKEALDRFCESEPAFAEVCESLEQLRALDLGIKIQFRAVAGANPGVDSPEDVAKIEEKLRSKQ